MTRRRLVVVAVSAAIIISIVTMVIARQQEPALDRAVAALRDDRQFTTALRAGEQFARASALVGEDAERCSTGARPAAECARRFEAAAYLRTAAVQLLGCSRPQIFDARTDALAYVRGLQHNRSTAEEPDAPALPHC